MSLSEDKSLVLPPVPARIRTLSAALLAVFLLASYFFQSRARMLNDQAARLISIRYNVVLVTGALRSHHLARSRQHVTHTTHLIEDLRRADPQEFAGIDALWRSVLDQNPNAYPVKDGADQALFKGVQQRWKLVQAAKQQADSAASACLGVCALLSVVSVLASERSIRRNRRRDGADSEIIAKFSSIIAQLPEAMLLIQCDVITMCNSAAAHLLGYSSSSELMGRCHSDLFAAKYSSADTGSTPFLNARDDSNDHPCQAFTWAYKSVTAGEVTVHVTLTEIGSNEPRAIIAVLHDLTEERRAQKVAEEGERRLSEMIENLPIGALLVEANRITTNRMVEQLTGYDRSELDDLDKWFALLYGSDAQAARDSYEANRQAGFAVSPVRSILRKDGTRRMIQFSALRYATSEVWILQDVSDRIEAERAAVRLAAILEATPDYIGSSTPTGEIFYSNRAFLELWDSAGLVPHNIQQCIPPDTYRILRRHAMPTAARNGLWQGECALLASEGKEIPVSAVVIAHRDEQGKVLFYSTIARDISARLEIENKLRKSEALLAEAQQVAHMGSYEYNYATRQLIWSEEVYRLFDREPALGPPGVDEIMEYYHPDDALLLKSARKEAMKTNGTYECDIRIRQRSGTYRWCHTITRATSDEQGHPLRIVGTLIDITATKRAQEQAHSTNLWLEETNKQLIEQQATVLQMHQRMEEQVMLVNEQALQLERQKQELETVNGMLQALATTDALTGIANHRAFQERLTEEWQRSERYKSPFSVILLDVDKFKTYNDAYGHPEGDVVLKMVARTLKSVMRDVDLVARYGGEEFVILLPETGPQGAREAAERCRAAIEVANWPKRPVTASFGAATTDVTVLTAQELIDNADRALYVSKENGRNRVTHHTYLTETTSEGVV